MNTKIVYVVTSNGLDIYVEQAYISIWTCKYYNYSAEIIVVADSDSQQYLNKYKGFNELVSNYIFIDFNTDISKTERSRILKTTLREIIKGDFLFVDTDTIFCDSIDEIDNFSYNIGMVYDYHEDLLIFSNNYKEIISRYINIYGNKPRIRSKYFNSGVIFCKDTFVSHIFYKRWHENWIISKKKSGKLLDQIPLLQTENEYPKVIKSIPGIYNAQVSISNEFLHNGKIIHIFNNIPTSFRSKYLEIIYQIKINTFLNSAIISNILDLKKNSIFFKYKITFLKEIKNSIFDLKQLIKNILFLYFYQKN